MRAPKCKRNKAGGGRAKQRWPQRQAHLRVFRPQSGLTWMRAASPPSRPACGHAAIAQTPRHEQQRRKQPHRTRKLNKSCRSFICHHPIPTHLQEGADLGGHEVHAGHDGGVHVVHSGPHIARVACGAGTRVAVVAEGLCTRWRRRGAGANDAPEGAEGLRPSWLACSSIRTRDGQGADHFVVAAAVLDRQHVGCVGIGQAGVQ